MTDDTEPASFDLLKISPFGLLKKKGPDKKYATFNRRMMAATIDSLILMIFTTPIVDKLIPMGDIMAQKNTLDASDPLAAQRWAAHMLTDGQFITSWLENIIVQMLIFCLFSAICWHFWSATPGKMLLRIKVVDTKTEQHITDRQIFLRIWGYVVSSICFFIGFFWISFDKRRQGWHDKIADTVVVVMPWRKSIDMPPS